MCIRDSGGYARWALLPEDPTWESYKALFLYEPGFFVLFWNSIKICAGVLAGHAIFAVPCAYGFAMYEFKFKKNLIYDIYHLHDDAVSGADAARIYGT